VREKEKGNFLGRTKDANRGRKESRYTEDPFSSGEIGAGTKLLQNWLKPKKEPVGWGGALAGPFAWGKRGGKGPKASKKKRVHQKKPEGKRLSNESGVQGVENAK